MMNEHVEIVEVAPRDGLQNEPVFVPTVDKIRLVDQLSDCGLKRIEVSSFVNPKRVPQMADAAEVLNGIRRDEGVTYAALTPNMHGYEAAMRAGAGEVAIFASASEGFSQKNINCSIRESVQRFLPIIRAAQIDKIQVRGYISCITDCPYDGPIAPNQVKSLALQLLDEGCFEISLGDTIGHATPDSIERLLSLMLNEIHQSTLAGHFHDTKGFAIENIRKSLEMGIRVFDSSVGGLGGCPFADGAKGNVDTVAVARLLRDLGYDTGVNMRKLQATATFARSLRG